MSNPPPYVPSFSFSGFQETNPTDPPPGPMLDNEFADISDSLNTTITALSSVRRSDGALVNGIVTPESLASDLTIGVQTPTAWVTAHAYTAGNIVVQANTFYLCLVTHVSGVFATDLAAVKWVSVTLSITGYSADQITYDHTVSGLVAVNVKTALDEIVTSLLAARLRTDAVQGLNAASRAFARANSGLFVTPQCRLSVAGTAVPTADVLTATAINFIPCGGEFAPVWSATDGEFKMPAFDQTQVLLDSNGAHTNTHAVNHHYDWFAFLNAGVLTFGSGPRWAAGAVPGGDTSRGTGAGSTEVELWHGLLVNKNAITLRIGANSGDTVAVAVHEATYIGTIRCTAAGQTEDSRKARYVWNTYNRVVRHCSNPVEVTDTWNYTLATVRQANANTANEFAFVRGIDEDAVEASLTVGASNSNASVFIYIGMGLDSTTAFIAAPELMPGFQRVATASAYAQMTSTYRGQPGLGRHRLTWLEASNATGTTTWVGDLGNASNAFQSGMVGSVRA